jgi:integrase
VACLFLIFIINSPFFPPYNSIRISAGELPASGLMKGVDLNTARELMGHADMKMTLRYAHLAPNVKMRAVEMLDEDDED